MSRNRSTLRSATLAAVSMTGAAALCLLGTGVAQAGEHVESAGTFQSRAACESAIASFTATPVGGKYVCVSNGNPASSAEPTYTAYYHYWD
ncbi:hypothetical protein [Pseudonocardia sp. ICBG1293]|uniref:hypothetical protein n=1 Tax=Pseudonocardia sp. ICBG1293 TaxID=2844382 RepID=UPI001CCA9FC7|nr:hypothetical protein [Pseudonocardia sp. ICBG1293]